MQIEFNKRIGYTFNAGTDREVDGVIYLVSAYFDHRPGSFSRDAQSDLDYYGWTDVHDIDWYAETDSGQPLEGVDLVAPQNYLVDWIINNWRDYCENGY